MCFAANVVPRSVGINAPMSNMLFKELLPDLRALGFDIEPFGKQAYLSMVCLRC